jgi:hypothetical protein
LIHILFSLFLTCTISVRAKTIKIPQSLKSVILEELNGTKDLAQSVKLTTLGIRDNINYVWIVFHGDTPNFYTKELASDREILHQRLISKNNGALLIQPKSFSSKSFNVMAGQGWGDIYGKGYAAQKMTQRKEEFGSMIIKIFRQLEKRVKNRSLKLQVVSFSGSGRVDRAFHEFLISRYQMDNNDSLRVKEFVSNHLYSVTACDSMVNNSFNDARQRPLIKSWVSFLNQFPHVKTTLIYDNRRTYPYMADMIEEVLQSYTGRKINLPIKTTHYRNQLKITNGVGHMGTFIGMLEHALFW